MSKKRNLDKDINSLFDTMHEVFRDCDEQKRKISATIKTRKNKYKNEENDIEDESKLGKLELDGLKLLNDVIDKKVKLVQIYSKLVATKQESSDDDNSTGNIGLSDVEMAALAELIKEEGDTEIKYNLKG